MRTPPDARSSCSGGRCGGGAAMACDAMAAALEAAAVGKLLVDIGPNLEQNQVNIGRFCRGGSGVDPGPSWRPSGVDARATWRPGVSIWGRSVVDLGSIGGGSGLDSGAMWGRSGDNVGAVWGRRGGGLACAPICDWRCAGAPSRNLGYRDEALTNVVQCLAGGSVLGHAAINVRQCSGNVMISAIVGLCEDRRHHRYRTKFRMARAAHQRESRGVVKSTSCREPVAPPRS